MSGLGEGKGATLALAVAACCALLLLAPAGGAEHSPTVTALKADDADLAAKSRAAVLELYSLDARLASAQQRLTTLRAASDRLTQQRAALSTELRLARLDTTRSQNRLGLRLRFLYEHGTVSSLDVVMGAKSLQDALTQLDDFNRVVHANAVVVLQVRAAQRHLLTLQRTIAARSHALAATTAAATQAVGELEQLQADRVAYISGLASRRSLDATRVARITAEAHAAVVRTQTVASTQTELMSATTAPAVPATPAPIPAAAQSLAPAAVSISPTDGATLTVVATGYDLPGHTSAGLPVGWGIAAVDPSVIPLGTRFVVPGYGVAVAADTGGAIVGDTIDLWFPSATQAYAWGRRTVTISFPQS